MHDIVGHYNRFDVFNLQVNRRPQQPVEWLEAAAQPFWAAPKEADPVGREPPIESTEPEEARAHSR